MEPVEIESGSDSLEAIKKIELFRTGKWTEVHAAANEYDACKIADFRKTRKATRHCTSYLMMVSHYFFVSLCTYMSKYFRKTDNTIYLCRIQGPRILH